MWAICQHARRCFACHAPETAKAGLHLETFEAALAELTSGLHAIVPGDSANSELLVSVAATRCTDSMPPEGRSPTPKEIDTLKQWIHQGAEGKNPMAVRPSIINP